MYSSYISVVQTEGKVIVVKSEEQIPLKPKLADAKLEKVKISLGDLIASQGFTRYGPIFVC